jgi:ABC-type uncharacterized transport system fused permease/ATPase subunit
LSPNAVQLPDYLTDAGEMAGYVHRVGELLEHLNQSSNLQTASCIHIDNQSSCVTLRNVSVTTITGRYLQQGLDFVFSRGNSLITGPSGCGKTSLLRAVAGFQRLASGTVQRPPTLEEMRGAPHNTPSLDQQGSEMTLQDLHFVMFSPTNPYIVHDSLFVNLTMPEHQSVNSVSVVKLQELVGWMHALRLDHLLHEEDCAFGLGVVRDWCNILSAGEQQRLAIVRILWHRFVPGTH